MNIDFHYFVTYLMFTGLGYTPEDSGLIANAAQYVDDNTMRVVIDKGRPTEYRTVSTFSIDLAEKPATRHLTYAFHFSPSDPFEGDPLDDPFRRKDGKSQSTITTPGNKFAAEMVREAFATGSLYEFGIALHTYQDTFAHGGFCGHDSGLNAVTVPGCSKYHHLSTMGHAQAGHTTDLVVNWRDDRFVHGNINNHERHLAGLRATAELIYALRYPVPTCNASVTPDTIDIYQENKKSCIEHIVNDIGIAMMEPPDIVHAGNRELKKYKNKNGRQYA